MATLRYQTEFKGAAGSEFLVRIYDLETVALGWGFTGYKPLTINGDGLTIDYNGNETTHIEPIVTSTCTLDLILRNDDDNRLVDNIEAGSEFQFALEIMHRTGATASGQWDPYWRGFLSPETVERDFAITPSGVTLTFTDGLATLRDVPFRVSEHEPYEGNAKLRKHIARALSVLPHKDLWDYTNAGDPFFVSLSDLYHSDHATGNEQGAVVYTDDPLFFSGTDPAAFYQPTSQPNPYGRNFLEEGAYYSCYKVLEDICVAMGLRLSHAYGRFIATSPTVFLSNAASTEYVTHGRKTDARAMLDPSFMDSASTLLSSSDTAFRLGRDVYSVEYDIAVGSTETYLPAVASGTYVHSDGGIKSVFRNADVHHVGSLDCFPHPPAGTFRPRGPRQFDSGISHEIIPSSGLTNLDATLPENTGLRLQGTINVRLRNPRNGSTVGTAANQARVRDQMVGCKIVCELTIKAGSYYLVQDLTQMVAADFTDESDFGAIDVSNTNSPGTLNGDKQYYPLEAATAGWTTSPGVFAFDMANFEHTTPLIQGIEYDDENGEVTSYPVGCWTLRDNHNTLRYDQEVYNHWTADAPAETDIDLASQTISFTYPNPVMKLDLDLQTPPIPDGVQEQTGITFNIEFKAFTAEGDLLPDGTHTSFSVGDDWLGNVMAGPASISNFKVFVGNGESQEDTFYRVSEANPRGFEHVLFGRSAIGSRYAAANGPIGYLTHSNSGNTVTDTYSLGWKMISESTTDNNRGNYQELANSGYQFRSKNRSLYNFTLLRRPGKQSRLFAAHCLFHLEYGDIDQDCIVLNSSHNLHREEVTAMLLEISSAPRTVTEIDNNDRKGEPSIGGGGYPPVVLGGKFATTNTGGVAPADVTKLGFLNTNSAGDGIDTIDGFTGGGGSVSADDQLKLDAITIDASGNITDFTVAGQPLTSDEIEDASSSHKFATAGQLTQIATNQSDISTNATNITGISNGLSDIQSFFKDENTGDGVGVYIDTTDTGKSHVSVTETAGKLQVGERTVVDMSETSPGSIAMKVQAGATGSEAQVTAIQISGSPTVNTKATVNVTSGDFRVSSPTQFNQGVTFAGGSNTVTFTAGTSGIDYGDLDNAPTVPTATSQLTNDSGFVTTDTNTNIGDTNLTLSADRTLTCSANDLTISNPGAFTITGSSNQDIFKVTPGTPGEIHVIGDLRVDSGMTAPGGIKLEELQLAGNNYIKLQAPYAVTSDVTLTFPDGAGSSGQVLSTNGTGTLSWVNRLSDTNTLVKGVLTIERVTSGNVPRLYIKGEDNLAGVFLKAPEAISTDVTFQLPETDGTNGQVLQTDGSGNLSFATVSGGGGGGPIILGNISGRYMWSSADDGERVHTGNFSYGPFNWYSFTSEPSSSTFRSYSASDAVGTTTVNLAASHLLAYGFMVPTTDKKVKIHYAFRLQNAPASSTWGFSLWGANRQVSGNSSSSTATLRAETSDITQSSNSSSRVFHGTMETTADFAEGVAVLMAENRSGSLTSTTYMYAQFQIELVD